jgi:endonuclease-8
VPEGDSLHRAAERLQVLVGERLEVETPHPRASVKGIAERLGGRRLESVEAVGKHLLLRFEGGFVLRSHLRMTGRWRVGPVGERRTGQPWLVLRGDAHEAVLWNGPVLELGRGSGPRVARLGPDILGDPPDYRTMLRRLRGAPRDRDVGDALLDQRLVAGIGNVWKAEALWEARVSPWRALADVGEDELASVLEAANRLMRESLRGARPLRHVYRRAGRGCPRCGTPMRSRPQGDDARTAYWCPACQPGPEPGRPAAGDAPRAE